jgi:putative CocE/NonD family hydrolase
MRWQPTHILLWAALACAVCLCGSSCGHNEEGLGGDEASAPRCDSGSFVPEVMRGRLTEAMVPMRDCTRLATDIYLPEGAGPLPVILVRLPYGKRTGVEDLPAMRLAGFLFAASGYAVVIQDTRGRYGSEGVFVPFAFEQSDGLDTLEWILAQPWSDGSVGMFGGSYFGFTQLAVACQQPKSLKALIPLVTPSSVYSTLYCRGLPRLDLAVNWALDMYREGSMQEGAFWKAAVHWPLREADDITVGDVPWFDQWLDHPFEDSFYDAMLPLDAMERVETPMLMLSGWFDIFAQTQLEDFARAQAREEAAGTNRIIIGPWTHSMGFDEHHDLAFPAAGSILSHIDLMIGWFDHFLKGLPLEPWGPVRIYDPGTGTWGDRATLWPPGRAAYSLYLAGDQGAVSCRPAGRLVTAPPHQAGRISYHYDPLRPVVAFGGPLLDLPSGCLLEASRCDRGDVVTFESDPFARSTRIDGAMVLELRISSSAPDTAFVGRVSLIRQDGSAYFLRQGVTTLSHRLGDRHPAAYVPGEVTDIRIEMPPLLWTIQPGERIRVEVMSSSLPAVAQHPNVDADWFSVSVPQPAEQTLHLDPDHPSRLMLEVASPLDGALPESGAGRDRRRAAGMGDEGPGGAGGFSGLRGELPFLWTGYVQ